MSGNFEVISLVCRYYLEHNLKAVIEEIYGVPAQWIVFYLHKGLLLYFKSNSKSKWL